ncbi:hypothetical protein L598_000900001120 [Mesorhizobium sp. J18]|uniref:hypothetical protein n=1 Tax=Mesorhizobium sp. J18 TaxID=935263 RepID=UPI001199F90C|nr:hypothetical protein [Mesorhizobium sp. J18]TWG89033.1 hypothetical protein L598_000900001120 [Mesorhizobium sp. J18]
MKEDDDRRRAEARRILEDVAGEGDIGSSFAARSADRARRHFSAEDADQADRIEVWGMRIGRGLALIAAMILIVWLVGFLMR